MSYGAGAATPNYGSMQSNVAGTLKTPGPRIMQSVERLQSSAKHMADISARLGQLADRLCGSVPEAVEKERESINSGCSVGMIEAQCEDLGMFLRRAENQLQRLEML